MVDAMHAAIQHQGFSSAAGALLAPAIMTFLASGGQEVAATRLVAGMLMASALAAGANGASAQDYPSKPVRIYSNQPGGIFDFLARILGQGLTGPLGQPVIIDNRPGNIIPAEIVSKAPPDGYSLLSHGGALAFGALMQKMPYDPAKDFAPISWTTSAPLVVTVHPSVPVTSVRELIALAKARPGALNYASTATGGTPHLAAELFKSMAGVDITHIPYKGAGAAMIDVMRGQVHLIFAVPNAIVPHVKTGRLRALAVTSAEPSVLLPGLPTVAGTGLPGYESVAIFGMFAPARTPEAIIRRLHQEIVRVLNTEDARKRLLEAGIEPVGSTPVEFAAKLESETLRMDKVIKAAGIRMD
jgi:tripartite-type tricarboxylate transporter receptor subunit TctC